MEQIVHFLALKSSIFVHICCIKESVCSFLRNLKRSHHYFQLIQPHRTITIHISILNPSSIDIQC